MPQIPKWACHCLCSLNCPVEAKGGIKPSRPIYWEANVRKGLSGEWGWRERALGKNHLERNKSINKEHKLLFGWNYSSFFLFAMSATNWLQLLPKVHQWRQWVAPLSKWEISLRVNSNKPKSKSNIVSPNYPLTIEFISQDLDWNVACKRMLCHSVQALSFQNDQTKWEFHCYITLQHPINVAFIVHV